MPDILIISPFVLILVTYILYFFLRKKVKIGRTSLIISKGLHYFFLSAAVLLIILAQFEIYLNSIIFTKIIAMILLITGLFLSIFRDQYVRLIEKIYFRVVFYSPLILLISFIYPMFGIVVSYNFSLFFWSDLSTIVYNDENYMLKLEEGFLVYDFDPTLSEKGFIFRKEIQDIDLSDWNFEKDLEISQIDDFSIRLNFGDEDDKRRDTIIYLSKTKGR